ncbi:GDYXXLXY domain-containing protein [Pontibacter sp. MBLB2868]|uniref:GDYXXLXY domain-containing protein n=1 Tax=Pontibacter sp. MBLB2868 TaxID=3451555 RepID=UPI003F74C4A7
MLTKRGIVILVNLLLVLGLFNWSVVEKEETLAEGKLVLLKLAPVDPRSLMQGDYMQLNYAISQTEDPDKLPAKGYAVVKLDEQGVAQLLRYQQERTPPRQSEQLIKYNKVEQRVTIGAEAYFFEEGQGRFFEQAEYGGLKVDDKGNSILVGLFNKKRQLIQPGN